MVQQIHQILPVLDERDAIGNYAIEIQKLLIAWGYDSKIFVWRKQSGQGNSCYHYSEHKKYSSPENVLICHYAISSPVFDYFQTVTDKTMMIYHNITPPEYARGMNDELYFLTKEGLAALRRARKDIDLVAGVSPFNQRELIAAGFSDAQVMPLLIDFEQFEKPADESVLSMYKDGKTNLLFVGRILPNKKQEDLIRTFYYYKRYINADSRLLLVGTTNHAPKYQQILEELVKRLELDDVIFTGSVPQSELQAYFQVADAFVCMSEHEGFCVPLLEAMYHEIPIVAYASSAIPETLGNGGIVVHEKDPLRFAALVDSVVNDAELRNTLIENQCKQVDTFSRKNVENIFKTYIEQLAGT